MNSDIPYYHFDEVRTRDSGADEEAQLAAVALGDAQVIVQVNNAETGSTRTCVTRHTRRFRLTDLTVGIDQYSTFLILQHVFGSVSLQSLRQGLGLA